MSSELVAQSIQNGDTRMKVYLITTGTLFGLITAAHIARLFAEPHFQTDVVYLLLTLIAAGLCGWAWRLYRKHFRSFTDT